MALFFRYDINQMGGSIRKIERKKRHLFSSVYSSELMFNEQVIPCTARFYPFGAYRVEEIDDFEKSIELGDILGEATENNPVYYYTFVIRYFLGKIAVIASIYFIIRAFNADMSAVINHRPLDWRYFYYMSGFAVSLFIKYILNLV